MLLLVANRGLAEQTGQDRCITNVAPGDLPSRQICYLRPELRISCVQQFHADLPKVFPILIQPRSLSKRAVNRKPTDAMQPRVSLRSYVPNEPDHRHEFHQIVLPFSGKMELRASRRGHVHDSSAAFVRAGEVHSFSAATKSRFIVLDLPPDEQRLHPYNIPPFFHIDPVLRSLLDYLRAIGDHGADRASAWMTLLLDQMTRVTAPVDMRDMILDRACSYMRMRLADPTTVADVAREAGTSVSGLKRLLRAKLDTTPAAYLSTLRIDEAERLLAEGRLPIAEIAMVTGYSDQSALNRAVRRERGTTPARIRKTPIAKD